VLGSQNPPQTLSLEEKRRAEEKLRAKKFVCAKTAGRGA